MDCHFPCQQVSFLLSPPGTPLLLLASDGRRWPDFSSQVRCFRVDERTSGGLRNCLWVPPGHFGWERGGGPSPLLQYCIIPVTNIIKYNRSQNIQAYILSLKGSPDWVTIKSYSNNMFPNIIGTH